MIHFSENRLIEKDETVNVKRYSEYYERNNDDDEYTAFYKKRPKKKIKFLQTILASQTRIGEEIYDEIGYYIAYRTE